MICRAEIQSKNEQLKALEDELNRLKKSLEDQNAKDQEIARLRKEAQEAFAKIQTLNQTIENSSADFNSQLRDKQSEINKLSQTKTENEKTIAELKESIAKVESEKRFTMAKLIEQQNKIMPNDVDDENYDIFKKHSTRVRKIGMIMTLIMGLCLILITVSLYSDQWVSGDLLMVPDEDIDNAQFSDVGGSVTFSFDDADDIPVVKFFFNFSETYYACFNVFLQCTSNFEPVIFFMVCIDTDGKL